MTFKKSSTNHKSESTPNAETIAERAQTKKSLRRNRDLLLALSRVAHSVQRTRSPEDIYRAMGEEIKALGYDIFIFTICDDRQFMALAHATFSPTLLRMAEKLTGISQQDYRLPVAPETIIGKIIAEGKTKINYWTGEALAEMLPKAVRPLAGKLAQILKVNQSIFASLRVDDEILGALIVCGMGADADDVLAIESFAAQVSVSLHNARLAQQAQAELSARRQADEALLQSEEKYRRLFAEMLNGFSINEILCDADGKPIDYVTLEINRAFEDMLNVKKENVVGKKAGDVLPKDELKKWVEIFGVVALTGKSAHYEMYSPVNNKCFEGVAYCPEKGKFAVMFSDVTERKQAEETLRASESKFHDVITESADGIMLTDETGRIIEFNNALEKITCYKRETGLGKFVWDFQFQMVLPQLQTPERFAQAKESIQKALETGQATFLNRALEVPFKRADGAMRFIQQRLFAIRTDKGWRLGGISRDITERKQAEDELRRANESLEAANRELELAFAREHQLACTDGLTDLYNRRYFFELATREFSAALRYQRPLAVVLFDVDRLKQINDTFGHLIGDKVLTLVAQAAITQVRVVDVLARYGGDEFVVLLPQSNAQQAFVIAERIRAKVAEICVETDKGQVAVTLSVGVAEINRLADESAENIIRRADEALYAAKQAGRNRTIITADSNIP